MKKLFSSKLLIFVVLIAIGIFSVMGLNEFASRSNQEEQQQEIATEVLEKKATLNEEGIDTGSIEEIEENNTPESNIENNQKTSVDSNEKMTQKVENKTAETKTDKDSLKQEAPPAASSNPQKKQVEQQNEMKQVIQDNSEKGSNNQEEKEEIPPPEVKKNTVLVTIVGPKDLGTILNTTQIEISESDTVLDSLQRVTREKKIQMEFKGTSATAYVEGINNIYEFDRGPESGWMFSVNGVFPTKSAGAVVVKPDDHIQWLYTEDLGKDIGANR